MDLTKSYEFFDPAMVGTSRVHLIGCGAVGSAVAVQLVRYGIENITLYDFDTVEEHNLANQMYRRKDVGRQKTEALAEILSEVNPDISKHLRHGGRYTNQMLSGYVILAVDQIELRRQIAEANRFNTNIKGMFDFRMGLTDGQHFAADWSNADDIEQFIGTMQFSNVDAAAQNPRSACNVELSVVSTPIAIVSAGIANMLNFIKGETLKHRISMDIWAGKFLAV